jgi:hypothetical protein
LSKTIGILPLGVCADIQQKPGFSKFIGNCCKFVKFVKRSLFLN